MSRSGPPGVARHHLTRGLAAAVAAALVSLLSLPGVLLATIFLVPVMLADSRRAAARRTAARARRSAVIGAGTAVGPVRPGRRYRSRAR